MAAAALITGLEARPASAADINPYVGPLRAATANLQSAARQIAALERRSSVSETACLAAADRLGRAAKEAEDVFRTYQRARLRFGTQEEFELLRSLESRINEAGAGVRRVSGVPPRKLSTGEVNAARREVGVVRRIISRKVAERFRIEGLEDVLNARSLREFRNLVINEIHRRVKTEIESELRRITGVGISLGVPLKVQIRRHAEIAMSRLLSKLAISAGPAGIVIKVFGKRILRALGAKLREALRVKGNLPARTQQSIKSLEKHRRALNALPTNASTDRVWRSVREAARAHNATKFLEGDLTRARDADRLKSLTDAKDNLKRTATLTAFRFLFLTDFEFNFRGAAAAARRAQRDAAAAAKKCGESKPAPPPPVAKSDFTGIYSTTYGKMILRQSGNRVTGCYEKDKGTLTGTVSGKVLFGTWKEEPHKTDTDRGGIAFTKTGSGFTGKWNYDRDGGEGKLKESPTSGGNWTGSISQSGPDCKP